MSSARQRRLSGLGPPDRAAGVTPPAPTEPPEPNESEPPARNAMKGAKPRSRRQSGRARAVQAKGGKHRRAVTVPTELVEQLRRRAAELDRYQTDLILDCLAATAGELEQVADGAKARGDGSPFTRPRRHAHRGRTVTTLTLYLTRAEVEAMDALAQRLGCTRSGIVTRALEHGLEDLE